MNESLKIEMEDKNMLGEVFTTTNIRIPKSEWKLIAIDIYGRYVMQNVLDLANVQFYTKQIFEKSFMVKL